MSAIAEKIRKLLELSKSENPHEAAAFAARAQELMLKYALDEEEVRGRDPKSTPAEPVETAQLRWYGQKIPAWEVSLAGVMSGSFFCRVYATGGVDISAVGRRSSIDAFRATWEYVRGEIARLRDRDWDRIREAERAMHGSAALPGIALRSRRAFAVGAVREVGEKLQEDLKRLAAPVPSGVSKSGIVLAPAKSALAPKKVEALVLARQTEVDEWMRAHGPKLRSAHRIGHRLDVDDAYERGRKAGRTINLSPRPTKFLDE